MEDEFDKILTDEVRKMFVIAGRRGGKKTALRGPGYYRRLQKLSVKSRKMSSPPIDEQIMELVGDGMSDKGIAKLMKVPLERVEEVKKQSYE